MCFNTQLEAKITPIGNRWCCRHSYNPEPITLKLQEHNGTTNHKTFSDDDQSEVDEGNYDSLFPILLFMIGGSGDCTDILNVYPHQIY